MKIGILTFHHTNNYGGSLQAVGLVQCLRSMGHEAGVVDYRPWKIHSRYIKSCVPGFSKVMSHVNQAGINELYAATITEAKNRLKKLSRMNEWVRINGMAISPPIWTHSGLVDAMNRLDLIVLGSDEIWKMKRKGGIDLAYFNGLKGVSTPAMSYAASVGESKSFGTYKDEIGSYLKMLIAIGVRDERTMKLVSEFGLISTIVIDPAFYIDNLPEVDTEKSPPYAVIAGSFSHRYISLAKSYCLAKKIKLVAIGQSSSVADESYINLDQGEWLRWISGASVVFTSLFHGVIFSLRLNKSFFVFTSPFKIHKISSLLIPLGVQDRILRTDEHIDISRLLNVPAIHYSKVFDMLELKAEQSKLWLKSTIESYEDTIEQSHIHD